MSQKGEYIPGSTFRPIKVVGSQSQVQVALNKIISRIQAASDQKAAGIVTAVGGVVGGGGRRR